MCPSCEQRRINPDFGVCDTCAAMYINTLDPNWQNTEIGRFLVPMNRETRKIDERIAHSPTGYAVDAIAAPTVESAVEYGTKHADVDELIVALVEVHGFGYRRVHAFLKAGGYQPPSLSTVKRRISRVRVAGV